VIERVYIQPDFARMGHYVAFIGRPHPGAPGAVLQQDGSWKPIEEGAVVQDWSGFRFPEGALDLLVAEYSKIAAPTPATERHLKDATAVRDRLLSMIEQRGLR
jgi:hypothetical protein